MLTAGPRRRRANGLVAPPASITLLKIALIAVAGVVVVLVGNTNRGTGSRVVRGLPWVVLVVLAMLVIWTILLGRTRFGRYIYAIGGNAEAARRAGVNTDRIRVHGLRAVRPDRRHHRHHLLLLPGVDLQRRQRRPDVLNAVAAAVIGGTSLFGGRGKMMDALLGGLVVGVIYNGLQAARPGRGGAVHLDGRGAARRGHRGRAGPPGQHTHLSCLAISPAVRGAGGAPASTSLGSAGGAPKDAARDSPGVDCPGVTHEQA